MGKKVQGSHYGLISDIFVIGLWKTMKIYQDTRPLDSNSGSFVDEAGMLNRWYTSEDSTVDGLYTGEL